MKNILQVVVIVAVFGAAGVVLNMVGTAKGWW